MIRFGLGALGWAWNQGRDNLAQIGINAGIRYWHSFPRHGVLIGDKLSRLFND